MRKKSHKTTRVYWKGKAPDHHEAISLIRAPGDIALVERVRPRSLVCMCPCGCGTAITLNLDRRAGKAWTLYQRHKGL